MIDKKSGRIYVRFYELEPGDIFYFYVERKKQHAHYYMKCYVDAYTFNIVDLCTGRISHFPDKSRCLVSKCVRHPTRVEVT